MKPTFEGELGLPKDESNKIDRALAKFSNISKDEIPASLSSPIDALMHQ